MAGESGGGIPGNRELLTLAGELQQPGIVRQNYGDLVQQFRDRELPALLLLDEGTYYRQTSLTMAIHSRHEY